MSVKLKINGKEYKVDEHKDTPLLWVLRETLNLKGTKFGCGIGICGVCSVILNGEVIRSCITPLGEVENKNIITIEGIDKNHPVKRAWELAQVVQCGYCQPGQIVVAYNLLTKNPNPKREEIIQAFLGNLCRCGTYPRIIKAVELASKLMRGRA